MPQIIRDLRFSLRSLLRTPGFSVVTVLTLAIGIGGTTAIFSVVNGVLLRPLPYPDPERIVQIRHVHEGGGSQISLSYPNFVDLHEQNRTLASMAAYASDVATVADAAEALRVGAAEVTHEFLDVLGVQPALGRGFTADEAAAASPAVAIVGYGYWRERLGGIQDLSSAVVRVGEESFRVVGVMPPGFSFPAGTTIWFPSDAASSVQGRTGHNFQVIGRLRDGATLEQAGGDLSSIARRLKEMYGNNTWMSDTRVIPLREQIVGSARPALMVLLGAAATLLLIGCANVINLLMARMASRRREIAVRLALGAGRRRLVEQFLAESLLLALAGGALGVLVASWGVPALLALEPGRLPRVDEVGIDVRVLAFALGASMLTALAISLAPAMRAPVKDLRGSLASGQRTQAGGAGSPTIRRFLAVSQIALTLVLLAGAGLLARSFARLASVDPGYRTDGAVVMDLWLPPSEGQAALARVGLFHEELLTRLGAIPGVEEVGGVNSFPLSGDGGGNGAFVVLNSVDEVPLDVSMEQLMTDPRFPGFLALMQDPARSGHAEFRIATDGYFHVMEIPLLRGRLFDERDAPDAPHVAVISESLADARWPGEDPIGKLIEYGNMDGDLRPFTIVGIVGDIRDSNLDAEPRPTFYGYSRQRPGSTYDYHVVLRGPADPAAIVPSARSIVREMNPAVPVRFRTLEEVFSSSLSERRFMLILMGAFGATALGLAMLGVYGVVSYLAAQRTREIGIRMALGAPASGVMRLLLRQGAALALAGVVIGTVIAAAVTRVLSNLLYGVSVTDAVVFSGAAALLGGVAMLASYIPARRAALVDPLVALRIE